MSDSVQKKRLSIILTGGTIVMVDDIDKKTGQPVRRPPANPREFAGVLPQLFKKYAISVENLMNQDSTDMQPVDWQKIANAVRKQQNFDPAGIVVVHGVDTICFSASAVSYALGKDLQVPVVFTGAQVPYTKEYGDALINLIRSAEVATTDFSPAEVMILFNNKAFRATRAQKRDDKDFDALSSPTHPPLILVKDPLEQANVLTRRQPNENEKRKIEITSDSGQEFLDGIIPIILSPGNLPRFYFDLLEGKGCTAIVLLSFGGTTIPTGATDGREKRTSYDYLELIKKAKSKNVPVIIGSHYATKVTEKIYDSTQEAEDAGAISISGYVLPALIAKLSMVLAKTRAITDVDIRLDVIKEAMGRSYVGEIDFNIGTYFFKKNIDEDIVDIVKEIREKRTACSERKTDDAHS